MNMKNNKNIIKDNKELTKKVKKLETKKSLIAKQVYRWLKEKTTWQYKYEREKVKTTIYKEGKCEGIDYLLQVSTLR